MTIRKQAFMHYSEQPLLDMIEDIYKAAPPLEIAGSTSKDPHNHRVSKTSWILPEGEDNIAIFQKLFDVSADASERAKWNFDAGILEPLQYTHYGVGDKYDWHVDQIQLTTMIMKIAGNLVLHYYLMMILKAAT